RYLPEGSQGCAVGNCRSTNSDLRQIATERPHMPLSSRAPSKARKSEVAVSDEKNRRILRDPEVRERTKLSRVQRWRRVRKGTFPAPVQLGPNSIGWYEDEIEAWIANRPRVAYAALPLDQAQAA